MSDEYDDGADETAIREALFKAHEQGEQAALTKFYAAIGRQSLMETLPLAVKAFEETKHPRDHGKFASHPGTKDAPKSKPAPASSHTLSDEQRDALRELHRLFPDGISHLLTDSGHVDRDAAFPEEAKAKERIATHREAYEATEKEIQALIEKDADATAIVERDSELNDEINAAFTDLEVSRDDFPGDDEAQSAIAEYEDALAELNGGSLPPDDEDAPDHNEYDVGDQFPEEDDDPDTLDDQESAAEGAVKEHAERLSTLTAEVAKHAATVAKNSTAWREETSALLGRVREAAKDVAAIPLEKYVAATADDDGDTNEGYAKLNLATIKKASERATAIMAKLAPKPTARVKKAIEPSSNGKHEPAANQHAALMLATLDQRIRELESGASTAGSDTLLSLWDDPSSLTAILGTPKGTIEKAWSEHLHPRNKRGVFISRERIHEAKTDPALADKLRAEVKPADADKLEDALASKTDTGRTARGLKRDATAAKRARQKATRTDAKRIADDLMMHPDAATPEKFRALAEHLQSGDLRKEELRTMRTFLGAKFGNSRRSKEMVAALLAHVDEQAKGLEDDAKPETTSSPPVEALPEEPAAPISHGPRTANKDNTGFNQWLAMTNHAVDAHHTYGGNSLDAADARRMYDAGMSPESASLSAVQRGSVNDEGQRLAHEAMLPALSSNGGQPTAEPAAPTEFLPPPSREELARQITAERHKRRGGIQSAADDAAPSEEEFAAAAGTPATPAPTPIPDTLPALDREIAASDRSQARGHTPAEAQRHKELLAKRDALRSVGSTKVSEPINPRLGKPGGGENSHEGNATPATESLPAESVDLSASTAPLAKERQIAAAETNRIASAQKTPRTDNESAALRWYKDGGYHGINGQLRTGEPHPDKLDDQKADFGQAFTNEAAASHLDSAIAKSPLPHPVTVFRGVGGKEYADSILNTPVGGTVTDNGFVSTTLSPQSAYYSFGHSTYGHPDGVVVKMVLPAGYNAAAITSEGGAEPELLLPRNQSFEVVSKTTKKDAHGKTYHEVTVRPFSTEITQTPLDNKPLVGDTTPTAPIATPAKGVKEGTTMTPIQAVSDAQRSAAEKARESKLSQIRNKVSRLTSTAERAAKEGNQSVAERCHTQAADLQAKHDELSNEPSARFWLDMQHNDFGNMTPVLWDVLSKRRELVASNRSSPSRTASNTPAIKPAATVAKVSIPETVRDNVPDGFSIHSGQISGPITLKNSSTGWRVSAEGDKYVVSNARGKSVSKHTDINDALKSAESGGVAQSPPSAPTESLPSPADDSDDLIVDPVPASTFVDDDSPLDLAGPGVPTAPVAKTPPKTRPASTPAPTASPPPPAPHPLAPKLRAAINDAAGGRDAVRVRLADLRKRLPGVPSDELEAAIRNLSRRGELTLYPLDDPRQIGPADEAAAIHSGSGVPQHILYYGGIPSDSYGSNNAPTESLPPEPAASNHPPTPVEAAPVPSPTVAATSSPALTGNRRTLAEKRLAELNTAIAAHEAALSSGMATGLHKRDTQTKLRNAIKQRDQWKAKLEGT